MSEGTTKPKHYILFGYPRSGTTWLSEIIASSGELTYLHEPDNERICIAGLLYKMGCPRFAVPSFFNSILPIFNKTLGGDFLSHKAILSRYPLRILGYTPRYLEQFINYPETRNTPINRLKLGLLRYFYKVIKFLGFTRESDRLLIKSVHSGLVLKELLDQTTEKFTPIIVFRHPAAVVRSMRKLDNKDFYRGIENYLSELDFFPTNWQEKVDQLHTPLEKAALQIGIHHYYWRKLAAKKDILIIKHEDFLLQPEEEFRHLFQKLNLTFNNSVSRTIDLKNKKGDGYNTSRESSHLMNAWKGEFSDDELEQIKRGYNAFSNPDYTDFSNELTPVTGQ